MAQPSDHDCRQKVERQTSRGNRRLRARGVVGGCEAPCFCCPQQNTPTNRPCGPQLLYKETGHDYFCHGEVSQHTPSSPRLKCSRMLAVSVQSSNASSKRSRGEQHVGRLSLALSWCIAHICRELSQAYRCRPIAYPQELHSRVCHSS